MNNELNILSYLIRNENQVTEFIYAISSYNPFRDLLVKLLTNGMYGGEDIHRDNIDRQKTISGSIPDLSMLSTKVSILVEIKTSPYRGLTKNQPQEYLSWLASSEANGARFFVALIPSTYYHRKELENRIESFRNSNKQNPVSISIISWDDLIKEIIARDLYAMNTYIKDFCDLLKAWHEGVIIKFKFEEIRSMYNPNTAKSIGKIISVIEKVIKELEDKGYTVWRNFKKRWWDTEEGEYGGYFQSKDKDILWFGLWQHYWEYSGVPLCFGVHGKWDAATCDEFKKVHPQCASFPPGDSTPFFLENINESVLLCDDPVAEIVRILELDLKKLFAKVNKVKKA